LISAGGPLPESSGGETEPYRAEKHRLVPPTRKTHRSFAPALARTVPAISLLFGICTPPALAQQAGNVTLQANEQIFSVLAALNAAGYDAGLDSEAPSSPRLEARAWVSSHAPEVLPAITRFYAGHHLDDPADDLAQYISLALLLGPAPDFKLTVADADLPPDAHGIKDLVPLLQRFYREADLEGLWAKLQPKYEEAIASLSDPVRRMIAASDAYLRFPSGAYLGRTCTIDLNLLGASGEVQARIYGENYYVVAGRSPELHLTDIRHQYLHFLLDPLAVKYAIEIHQKEGLASLARPAPALGADFKADFSLLLTECLIRAVELRMDKPARPQETINELTNAGLILVPYFYEALGDYAKQDASMNVYYRQMVLGITPAEERKRLASVKFSPAQTAPAAVHPAPRGTEEDRLLDQADDLIYQGRYLEAKDAFQNVLDHVNAHSERALFGLAVVASNTRKPDTAEEYFKKTLEVARGLRIVTWSHIYLGRLYDLEDRRKDALDQYRAASITAAAFPQALQAVQSGLARSFGAKP
jgi:tetratricopeptide (TPR) repeat protein